MGLCGISKTATVDPDRVGTLKPKEFPTVFGFNELLRCDARDPAPTMSAIATDLPTATPDRGSQVARRSPFPGVRSQSAPTRAFRFCATMDCAGAYFAAERVKSRFLYRRLERAHGPVHSLFCQCAELPDGRFSIIRSTDPLRGGRGLARIMVVHGPARNADAGRAISWLLSSRSARGPLLSDRIESRPAR